MLAIEHEAEMKAQRDADEIQHMLAEHILYEQLASTIGRPSPKHVQSRVQSVMSMSEIDSPRVSLGNSLGSSSPRERTDYGLPKEAISMLVTGANFIVPNFLGLKTPKFFYVTTDIASIASRSSSNHQHMTPFDNLKS